MLSHTVERRCGHATYGVSVADTITITEAITVSDAITITSTGATLSGALMSIEINVDVDYPLAALR